MSAQMVTLDVRPRREDGTHPYLLPAYGGNNRIRPGYAMVAGEPRHYPGVVYYLRYVVSGKRVPAFDAAP